QPVEIASYRALDGTRSSIPGAVKCWNSPAISKGRIYVRSTTEAVALDVAPPPALRLDPTLTAAGGGFQLVIGTEDNSPLDTNRVARIDLFGSTDLLGDASTWAQLTNGLLLTNGQIRFGDPESATRPRRFFKAAERP